MKESIKKRIEAVRRGEVPEGYVSQNHQLHPVDWKYEKIGKYMVPYDEFSNDTKAYPLATSSRQGLMLQSEYYIDQRYEETTGGFHVVPVGYVTYRHMSDDDIFRFNLNKIGQPVLVSPEYPVFTTTGGLNQDLLVAYLNGMKEFQAFCSAQKKGSTRTRMYFRRLCKFTIPIPSITEQQKIAEILATCDRMIELKQSKIDELNKLKQVCLLEMFPQKGQTIPKRRFPGFSAPWEQRKLGELALFNPKDELPQTFEYVDLESVVGTEMLSHRTEVKSSAPSRAQRLAHTGDLFYQTVRPYQKNNYLFEKLDNNYVFSTGYAQMRPYVDGYFLLSLVQSERFVKAVLDNCTGTSYPAINANDLAEIEVVAPSDESEAQKIGTIFRSIDHLITLHQRELAEVGKYKKALMQLLLTGLVRVNV